MDTRTPKPDGTWKTVAEAAEPTVKRVVLTRLEKIDRIENLIENAHDYDLSDADVCALNWLYERYHRYRTEIRRINSLRPSGTPMLTTVVEDER